MSEAFKKRKGIVAIITPPGPLLPRPIDEQWAAINWIDWSEFPFPVEISSYGMVRRPLQADPPLYKYYKIQQHRLQWLEVFIRDGYKDVRLSVAPAVLKAFGHLPSNSQRVRYRDGSYTNCTLTNLFWGTQLDQLISMGEIESKQQKQEKRTNGKD